jgi:multiple RNA-binding domain-containing protein 1
MSTKRNARPTWSGDIDEAPQSQVANQKSPSVDKKKTREKAANVAQNVEESEANQEEDVEEVSDMEWLKRKMQKQVEISADKDFEQSDEEMGSPAQKVETLVRFWHRLLSNAVLELCQEDTKQSHSTNDTILSNGRLFVRNLVFSCTEDELRGHFQQFGDVKEVSHFSFLPISLRQPLVKRNPSNDVKLHRDNRP